MIPHAQTGIVRNSDALAIRINALHALVLSFHDRLPMPCARIEAGGDALPV